MKLPYALVGQYDWDRREDRVGWANWLKRAVEAGHIAMTDDYNMVEKAIN